MKPIAFALLGLLLGAAKATGVSFFIPEVDDDIVRATTNGLAPWPDVRSARIDPVNRPFTMSWKSAPGATYDIYGWDPITKRPTLVQQNILATGDPAFISRLLEEEGTFWVVLTSSPPPPEPVRQ